MVNSSFNCGNFFVPQGVSNKKETELGIFYLNDLHGNVQRLANLKTAHDTFEKSCKNTPNMTVSAGDLFYGQKEERNSLIIKVLNMIKLSFTALGNHEFDAGSDVLSDRLEKCDFKALAANLKVSSKGKLKERLKDKKLVQSSVHISNGKKFGVIGVCPTDEHIDAYDKPGHASKIMDLDKTIKSINTEAKKLEQQGIDKIVLLSHIGYGNDRDLKIAKETEGIDIIIGGHTHHFIDGVNADENSDDRKQNLVKSKRNEPVLITQAGVENRQIGFVDAVFDKNGVLIEDKIINKTADTDSWKPSKSVEKLLSDTLGENKLLAQTSQAYYPENEAAEREMENPIANLLTDSFMEKARGYGAEAVITNSSNPKKGLGKQISTYDIKYSLLPYDDDVVMVPMSEKHLVQLLNRGATSVFDSEKMSDLYQCAGIRYTLDKNLEPNYVKEIEILDEDGDAVRIIDGQNPDEDNYVNVVLTSYLFKGIEARDILEPYNNDELKEVIGKQQEIFSNYLKSKKQIDIKPDERIRILK